MFDRVKYKKFAKKQLQGRWTIPVLVTLFCSIIVGVLQFPDTINSFADFTKRIDELGYSFNFTKTVPQLTGPLGTISQMASFIAIAIAFVLEIAEINLYLKMSISPEPVSFGTFIEGFALWARGILASLWAGLWIFLWSLLFIIPGIVKAYAYSMTLYLVAENPELSVTKALKISKEITKGHKMDLFILDLSFIGWEFLCLFTAGIGYLWLVPYINMTKTNAYHALLKEAVSSGNITVEDLKD
ncbi:MAG: DUF975 family protein [Treponema sp.]|nr:DUF975 family protein [Treponema sp.]